MVYKLIPIKNIKLENEVRFLNHELKNDNLLVKKKFLFYKFEKCKESSWNHYAVDLVPPDEMECEIAGYTKLMTGTTYRNHRLKKIYYITPETDANLFISDKLKKRYYDDYVATLTTILNIVGFLILSRLVAFSLLLKIPGIINIIVISLIPIWLILFRMCRICEDESCDLSLKLEKPTGFEAEYIVEFKNMSKLQHINITEILSTFGSIKEVNKKTYRIKSILSRDALREEVLTNFNLNDEDFLLMHIGDLSISWYLTGFR